MYNMNFYFGNIRSFFILFMKPSLIMNKNLHQQKQATSTDIKKG